LNREARHRIESNQEPLRITLDTTPKLTPGRTQPTKTNRITVGNYSKPKDKQLVIAVREEQPAQPKPDKMRITI
jgi:hypothetical protein